MAFNERAVRAAIRAVPNFPKRGIMFRDITPLLKDPNLFGACIDEMAKRLSTLDFDYIAGIESRGFILGVALSQRMHKGFIVLRKAGKLPYHKTVSSYKTEYSIEALEIHNDAVEPGSRVLIVDDLLATGGTASAAANLIKKLNGSVAGYAFLIELAALDGRSKLKDRIYSLITY